MFPLTFGEPALEEFSCAGLSQHASYVLVLGRGQACGLRGDESARFVASRKHSLTSFQDF